MKKTISDAEINHLRRLLGWVSCEIGQSPEEMVATVQSIAPAFAGEELSDEAKQRLVATHEKAASVPKYVRQAVKALQKTLADTNGDTVDGELVEGPDGLPDHTGKPALTHDK